MKKFLTAFVSLLTIAALCVCFSGCATDVKGKTYVYDHAEISTQEELDELGEATANLAVAAVNKTFKDSEIVFSAEDDGVTVGGLPYKYSQDGEKVTVKTLAGSDFSVYTASGKTLTRSYESGSNSFTLIYKIK